MNIEMALQSLVPDAKWHLAGTTIEWLDNTVTKPTDEEIKNEINRLEDEWHNTAYQRNRKAEYDKLNQFEMQFNDALNGTTTWIDAINAIKAKYPK